MGGTFTKGLQALNTKIQDDSSRDPLDDPPVPVPPDPRLPLTAKQVFNISKSWKGIARAMETTGITMFVKLFEENEDLITLFKKFQYLQTQESRMESLELAQHASIVMTTLDEGIRSLNKVDYLIDHLHSVGKFHTKIAGFRKENFWRIEKPFLAAVKETLGDRYTENMENIYKITIRFILETLSKGFDLADEEMKENKVLTNNI
ncbi:neuroglobin-like [Tachypleus tridentatus]|uniref:neuroglobin-like n=1 Tax=Tachypleus tridentatus TaxID=6853 RepID=UPI003FD17C69